MVLVPKLKSCCRRSLDPAKWNEYRPIGRNVIVSQFAHLPVQVISSVLHGSFFWGGVFVLIALI